MMDDKSSISILIVALSVSSLTGLNGCERQDPSTKAVKELSLLTETVIGGMAWRVR